MLKDLVDIEVRFGDRVVDDVRQVANQLLQRQFLFAGDRGTTHAYEIVTGPRFRSYFTALFDALGYQLRISETEQWVGLLPDPELDLFPKMRMDKTIVLLILALAWQDAANRGAAEARAVVKTTLNEVLERYRDIAGRNRKEALISARFEDALREFHRRGLVWLGDWDPEAADREIEIRPMLHLLVGGNALDLLERFAAEAESAITRERRTRSPQDDGEQEGTEE
ncbi:DUF4194 domain-containing protein [Rhodospirillum centenum]|uniref:DUF4194 domain-containing protein n=1 Tax=Rhodospirillum centenum (strain ATCC 51521 / SW) TaxID=414684 RepID=B6IX13_RHOCS|nr:DUF4194 domain-containing protein [Rhodospirillum centenum]ACJ00837.1 conserved hypothetical protein [Rhodospirillum centenum SW]